jgi:uncharacterized protein YbcC (UPF0753/DUF2309 family)
VKGARLVTAVQDKISDSSACLNSYWPISQFIACNALKGFEGLHFDEALKLSNRMFGARGYLPLARYRQMYESRRISPGDLAEAFENYKNRGRNNKQARSSFEPASLAELLDALHGTTIVADINRQLSKWCAAYFDQTQAQWQIPKADGLYTFWRDLVQHDLSLDFSGGHNWRDDLRALPADSTVAVERSLAQLGVEEDSVTAYLSHHFAQLPGWASHIKWRQFEAGQAKLLSDFLAMSLFYEAQLSKPVIKKLYQDQQSPWKAARARYESSIGLDVEAEKEDYGPVWQDAYEINYRNRLLDLVGEKHCVDSGILERAKERDATGQLVFCIDVRSEPVRRHLEGLGNYDTFGFAGFFGLPMRFYEYGSGQALDICPALLRPEKTVREECADQTAAAFLNAQSLLVSAQQLRKRLKASLAGAFSFVETMGLWSALPIAGRTLFPQLFEKLRRPLSGQRRQLAKASLDCSSFSLDEKISLAEGALRAIDLCKNFAPLIVLCGHKSESVNNPYASALDCGACGGNSGEYSARLAAQLFNDPQVRIGLLHRGISITDRTWFVAAEHNTTTDTFEFFSSDSVPDSHRLTLHKIAEDMQKAGLMASKERSQKLPASLWSNCNSPMARSCDWAQVAPEWGLAGNAAFIAAPRHLSSGLNLEGRCFLHSYEYMSDPQGQILESIMTAPLVVAQWINMQYYLSTVDNNVFGSGSKTTHNVVGDFGVIQGVQSDLKLGLPLQSVAVSEGLEQHEPMRLLALIRAPRTAIDKVLANQKALASLVKNEWIRLIAADPIDGGFYLARDAGSWIKINGQPRERQLSHCSSENAQFCCGANQMGAVRYDKANYR